MSDKVPSKTSANSAADNRLSFGSRDFLLASGSLLIASAMRFSRLEMHDQASGP
jgi:hypothetical protein